MPLKNIVHVRSKTHIWFRMWIQFSRASTCWTPWLSWPKNIQFVNLGWVICKISSWIIADKFSSSSTCLLSSKFRSDRKISLDAMQCIIWKKWTLLSWWKRKSWIESWKSIGDQILTLEAQFLKCHPVTGFWLKMQTKRSKKRPDFTKKGELLRLGRTSTFLWFSSIVCKWGTFWR